MIQPKGTSNIIKLTLAKANSIEGIYQETNIQPEIICIINTTKLKKPLFATKARVELVLLRKKFNKKLIETSCNKIWLNKKKIILTS
jgi:hypothetical protein